MKKMEGEAFFVSLQRKHSQAFYVVKAGMQ
jgi:hypothetical protein